MRWPATWPRAAASAACSRPICLLTCRRASIQLSARERRHGRRHAGARARARRRVAARAGGGALVIGIEGELGAGKTTLVGGVLAGLGVTGAIRSPTYTLIEPYDAARPAALSPRSVSAEQIAREVEALGIRDLLDARRGVADRMAVARCRRLADRGSERVDRISGAAGAQRRLLRAQAGSSAGDKLLEQILAATSE